MQILNSKHEILNKFEINAKFETKPNPQDAYAESGKDHLGGAVVLT
jgi:hypothetical protein